MQITEVRIKLIPHVEDYLLAFACITIDGAFAVRDLRVIGGVKGLFVAMPSRKLTDRCPGCGYKNHLRARHCNQCGGRLNENRATGTDDGPAKLHADIAHPINQDCRSALQEAVLKAYHAERELEKLPGYQCRYEDFSKGD